MVNGYKEDVHVRNILITINIQMGGNNRLSLTVLVPITGAFTTNSKMLSLQSFREMGTINV